MDIVFVREGMSYETDRGNLHNKNKMNSTHPLFMPFARCGCIQDERKHLLSPHRHHTTIRAVHSCTAFLVSQAIPELRERGVYSGIFPVQKLSETATSGDGTFPNQPNQTKKCHD
jgi:hypothetical protein